MARSTIIAAGRCKVMRPRSAARSRRLSKRLPTASPVPSSISPSPPPCAIAERSSSAIVGQARDGICLIDTESLAFVEFNEAAYAGLGYSREEFARLTLADVQASLSHDEVHARIGEMLLAGGGDSTVGTSAQGWQRPRTRRRPGRDHPGAAVLDP